MTTYQERINIRLEYLYTMKKDWVRILKAAHRLGNVEVFNAIKRTCSLEMTEVQREITHLEGLQGDQKRLSREPSFSRKAEDALIFDNHGHLNEAGINCKWGEASDFPPVEPK